MITIHSRRLPVVLYLQEDAFLSGVLRDAIADDDHAAIEIYRERESLRRLAARILSRQLQDVARQHLDHMDRDRYLAALSGVLALADQPLLASLCWYGFGIRSCHARSGPLCDVENASRATLLRVLLDLYRRFWIRFQKGLPVRTAGSCRHRGPMLAWNFED